MTTRKHSPTHDFWWNKVTGQIRHTIGRHPEWFGGLTEQDRRTLVNSLAKRIVGEIVAGTTLAPVTGTDGVTCPPGLDAVVVDCRREPRT